MPSSDERDAAVRRLIAAAVVWLEAAVEALVAFVLTHKKRPTKKRGVL